MTIEEMQAVIDKYLVVYNGKRPHQGRKHERQASGQGLRRQATQNRIKALF